MNGSEPTGNCSTCVPVEVMGRSCAKKIDANAATLKSWFESKQPTRLVVAFLFLTFEQGWMAQEGGTSNEHGNEVKVEGQLPS